MIRETTKTGSAPAEVTLGVHAEELQIADSVDRVLQIIERAVTGRPGVGQAALHLVNSDGELVAARPLQGPAQDLHASDVQLEGIARRAFREGALVQQAGVTAESLWAYPLKSPDRIEAVVVAVGAAAGLPGFLAQAALALYRERQRSGGESHTHAMEERAADLEQALEVLDAIVREGGSGTVLRRITSAVAGLPGIDRATLWSLRAEDGRYVEAVANGAGGPAVPPEAQRAEGFDTWLRRLPTWADFRWTAGAPNHRTSPGRGDALVIPLSSADKTHPLGFFLAQLECGLDRMDVVEDLRRWAALGRQALESFDNTGHGIRNVEELREEKEKISELHRLKSQFIAAVSHELRTPLTSITAYAETLRSSPGATDPETQDRFLRVIYDESRRLTRIVDDILDLATMDSGRVRLSCRRVELDALVRDVVDVISPLAEERSVRATLPEDEELAVHGDPDLLKQLLMNLLENAIKFTDPAGSIEVGVEREASAVRVWVQDDGPGIPADKLDLIFERFYQIDGSNSRRHGGSGLGLAIARSITAWHDGRIWAESKSGQGSRFVVSLPRLRATSRQRASEPTYDGAPVDEHRVPELVIEMIGEVMGAESVSLMLPEEDGASLFIQAAMGLPDEAIRVARVAIGESISGTVARTGVPILVPDLSRDERFAGNPRRDQYHTESLISVPVKRREEVLGVLNVTNKASGIAFDESDLALLMMLAERVSLVICKLKEFGDSRDDVQRMEEALRGVIDVRRHYYPSGGFSRLVIDVCRELGLDDVTTSKVHYASILRDVGMTRLPEGVYKKPTALSAGDRELIRRHPEDGARMLRSIEFQSDVFEIILAHHEEPDGTGYPRGLADGTIPVGARVLGVLDAYHSLRSGRPYRSAVRRQEAIEELRRNAGGQFDPEVVEALVRVLSRLGSSETGKQPEEAGNRS
ncbi:MAG: GAF domain-containing protein [Gemmatimonadetes bacterium]|nr:GAF domain-containing protein [Gemmatimonadota bacterium]